MKEHVRKFFLEREELKKMLGGKSMPSYEDVFGRGIVRIYDLFVRKGEDRFVDVDKLKG